MKYIRILLSMFAIIPLLATSQTTTFNYLTTNLGTSCKVFSPSVNISSVPHVALAGGVGWSSTYGLQLSTIPSGPSAGGTAFTINYSFASGYNYTVAVTAIGNSALYLKTAVVPNLAQFNTHSTSSCTPDPYVTGYTTVGTGNISTTTGSNSTTYTTASFAGSSQPYLVVWATGGRSNLSLDVLSISKIEITKTAQTPATPSFTLPATTNVPCSSTTSVTFTATNVNSTPNVTDYTWNLGPTPNGWLYNGSAAPATVSTGTINNISLTPVSGSTPHSVSATVTVGGSNTYNTNTSNISITAPSLTITGPNSFCSSANYSINSPTNASVSWSYSPGSVVSVTNYLTPQVTVSTANPGLFNLTASVSACGNTYTVTKNNIRAGVYWYGDVYTSADQSVILQSWAEPDYNYICQNTDVYFHIGGANTSSQYSYIAGSLSNTPSFDGYNMVFHMDPGSYATFGVDVTDGSCTQTVHFTFVAMECGYLSYYSVAPNPATSDLTIYVDDEKLKSQKIKKSSDQSIEKVILLNKFGKAVLQQNYAPGTQNVRLNISTLPADMYLARIYNGKQWTSIKVFKK